MMYLSNLQERAIREETMDGVGRMRERTRAGKMLNAIYIIWLRELRNLFEIESRLISSIAQPLI